MSYSQLDAAYQQLETWLKEGRIRPIDLQLAKQLVAYSQSAQSDLASADLANPDLTNPDLTNPEIAKQDQPTPEASLVSVLFASCSLSLLLGRGQVCFDLNEWPLPDSKWQQSISRSALLSSGLVLEIVGADSLDMSEQAPHALLILENNKLYLRRYFDYQARVLKQIESRLTFGSVGATGESGNLIDADICSLLKNQLHTHRQGQATQAQSDASISEQVQEIDWQTIAVITASLLPFCVITGGPGTGKTTTVTRLLALLLQQQPNMRIALAAPTGKAAARMTESIRQSEMAASLPGIPSESFTLHRLLGWSPRGFRYHSSQPLPYDCILVDEASMIDLPMMARLLEATPAHARLILLGDQDQLSSVEAGSVLADLCSSGAEYGVSEAFGRTLSDISGYDLTDYSHAHTAAIQNAVVKLTKSHRFNSQSGIGRLAKAVNQSDVIQADQLMQSFDDLHLLSRTSWQEQVAQGYQAYCQKVRQSAPAEEVLAAFDQFQVLLALRQGSWGVEDINQQIEQLLHQTGMLTQTASSWYAGKAVMITQNDYDVGLFNGEVGVLLNQDGQDRVVFRKNDGSLRYVHPGRLPQHETAFATTVHKSQGSEYGAVMLVLPPEWQSVMTKELIYTAITRAKKNFYLVSEQSVWNASISQNAQRASGLRDALWR